MTCAVELCESDADDKLYEPNYTDQEMKNLPVGPYRGRRNSGQQSETAARKISAPGYQFTLNNELCQL